MNKPTSVLRQARQRIGAAGKRDGMVTITRRCVCALALVLLFVAALAGSLPNSVTRAQESLHLDPIFLDYGHMLRTMGNPAEADTLTDADQELIDECGCYKGTFSTRLIRHKTH
jgi:hypothetical protein